MSSWVGRLRRGIRPVLFRIIGVGLGFVLGLAAAEVALRALGIEPLSLSPKRRLFEVHARHFAYRCYDCYVSNPNGEFVPTPDTSTGHWQLRTNTLRSSDLTLDRLRETPWCVEYKKNSLNMRAPEIPTFPKPGVLRIGGIGDSFAMGEGVPEENSLFRKMGEDLGDSYEIVNFGVPGFDTKWEVRKMRVMIPLFHCKKALIIWVPNDVSLSAHLEENQSHINDLINIRAEYMQEHLLTSWYNCHLRSIELFGSILDNYRIEHDTVRWYHDCWDPRVNKANLDGFNQDLAYMAHFPDCQTAIVLYPLLHNLEGGYPFQAIHDQIVTLARTLNMPCLDLAPVFAGAGVKTQQLWVHPVDHHPNGRAHRIAAKAIVDWLRRDVPSFLVH